MMCKNMNTEYYSLSDSTAKFKQINRKSSEILWVSLTLIAILATLIGTAVYAQRLRATRAQPARADTVVCYYNIPDPHAARPLLPASLRPRLCTHINVAFASIYNNTVYLDSHQLDILTEVVKLKDTNHDLKILLSIGGAGEDNGFSDMVVNHKIRKVFIKSLKSILRNYKLDGIDLDWEFPAVHNENFQQQLEFKKRQRQHFSQLLREIRMEYIREKRNYLLTVAVAAPQIIVDAAYDVDQLELYVDFVNVMTYDFHYFTNTTPFTGLNSPLYARPEEHLYLSTLNINYTVHMYLNKGLSPNKIVVGIPTYGHSFTLVNVNNNIIGSPASGYGSLGFAGFVDYPELCKFSRTFKDVVIRNEAAAKVPYMFRGHEWVSFDTPTSVSEKALFIKQYRLRGAMMYSLNSDDYEGVCDGYFGGNVTFPLSQSVKNTLLNELD